MIKVTIECKGIIGVPVSHDLTGEEAIHLAHDIMPDYIPAPLPRGDGSAPDLTDIKKNLSSELEHYTEVLKANGVSMLKR